MLAQACRRPVAPGPGERCRSARRPVHAPLTGNPMDVHLHTGANLRRYLLELEGVSLKNSCWRSDVAHRSECARRRTDGAAAPAGSAAVAALPHPARATCWELSPRHRPRTGRRTVEGGPTSPDARGAEVKKHRDLAQHTHLGYDADARSAAWPRSSCTTLHRDARLQAHQATFEGGPPPRARRGAAPTW